MKKEYTAPEIEVVTFATEDVMAAGPSNIQMNGVDMYETTSELTDIE